MRRIELKDIGLIVLWALFILFVIYSNNVKAQDTIQVITNFEQGCIEGLDESHYRLHFHYISDGVEDFKFAMGDIVGSNAETLPYTGDATTNVPQSFSTSIGLFDEWYLEAQSEDSPYTFNLMFTNDIGVAILPLNTWENTVWCEVEATTTPTPTQNAANARVEPFKPLSTNRLTMSSGRTCAIQYPKIILVCTDGY